MVLNHNSKRCRPVLHCNPPTNIVYYVGYMVLLSYNTTDTFRRSKRIWLYHSPTLCRLSGTPKTTKSKEDKHFSWHLDDIYQNAFKHMENILAYPNLSKRSMIYTDTSYKTSWICWHSDNRPIAFFSNNWSCPMKNIVHRARTLAKAVKEVQGMFFYQNKVLTQDALGLTSDIMYRYQHLIEEWHCH